MRWLLDTSEGEEAISRIVAQAGGKVVGRTRLQKMVYLLTAAGFSHDFSFEYRHYGPFSEDLARATTAANLNGTLHEEEHPASWGGTYSVFISRERAGEIGHEEKELLQIANEANPIDLELAATAIFLAREKHLDPWEETKKRKPDKAKRIESAKRLMERLQRIETPETLPAI